MPTMESQAPDNRFFPGNMIVAEQLRIFQYNLHKQQIRLDAEQVSLTQQVEQQRAQITSQAAQHESLSSKLRSDLDDEKQARKAEVEELRGVFRDLSSRYANALADANKRYEELLEAMRYDREAQETRLSKLEVRNCARGVVPPEAELRRQRQGTGQPPVIVRTLTGELCSAQNEVQVPATDGEIQATGQLHFDPIESPLSTANTAQFRPRPPPPVQDPLNVHSDCPTTQRQPEPTRPLSRLDRTASGMILTVHIDPNFDLDRPRSTLVRAPTKTPKQQPRPLSRGHVAGKAPRSTLASKHVGVPQTPPRARTRRQLRMEGAALDESTVHRYLLERRPNTTFKDPPLSSGEGSCATLCQNCLS